MPWKLPLRLTFKYLRCILLVLVVLAMAASVAMVASVYRRKPIKPTREPFPDFDFDKIRLERLRINLKMQSEETDNEKQEPRDSKVNLIGKIKDAVQDKVPAKVGEDVNKVAGDSLSNLGKPNYNVHVFYYTWYRNHDHDGSYKHWNHRYIAHWRADEAARWPKGQHIPPGDIGANYYPQLGPYSSKDIGTIENHMRQIRMAGIGVLAVSWYPPGDNDLEGDPSDDIIPLLLSAADKYLLKICFHIEPYKQRNSDNMRENIKYVINKYGAHPAFYRTMYKGKNLPLFYVYDSYLVPHQDWQKLLYPDSKRTVRSTDMDAVYVGLVAQQTHLKHLVESGFDACYTYFAADRFTYGSSRKNWKTLSNYFSEKSMLFIPSVGPGYIDTRVRPWNGENTRNRMGGAYYNASFQEAIAVKPSIISVTSFNEWHEGTQIETAIPKQFKDFKYLSYEPNRPDYYIKLTREWIQKWMH